MTMYGIDNCVSGVVRSVNEKGLKLEGQDERRAREKARKRAWYLKNREARLAEEAARRAAADPVARATYQRAYRERNAERLRERRRGYYLKNRERILAQERAAQAEITEKKRPYLRAYYAANRERLAAQSAQYKRENMERVSFWNKRRLLAKRGAPISDFTLGQWVALKQAYSQRCAYCGKHSERLTQDHVIPLSRGGPHTARNILPACRSCNARKFTGPPLPLSVLPLWSDLVAVWGQV